MQTATLARTLATVCTAADAIAYVGDAANYRELCAAGRIDPRDADAFQNAVLRLLENPYSPDTGSFSTHWTNCAKAGKTKARRFVVNVNGVTPKMGGRLELDSITSRGNSGSADNAKSAYLGRFDPAPAEEREAANAKIRTVWEKLSPRQKKYLVLRAKGMENAEIARKFGISAGTAAQIAEYIRAIRDGKKVTKK